MKMAELSKEERDILAMYKGDTYSIELKPSEARRSLEDAGFITWVGELYGTQQYARTNKGLEANE